jgi:hypothetical protein
MVCGILLCVLGLLSLVVHAGTRKQKAIKEKRKEEKKKEMNVFLPVI